MCTHKWNYYLDQDTIFLQLRWITHSPSQLKSSYPHQRQVLIWLLFLVQELYEIETISKDFVVSGFFHLKYDVFEIHPSCYTQTHIYAYNEHTCKHIYIHYMKRPHLCLLDIKVVSNFGLLWIKLLSMWVFVDYALISFRCKYKTGLAWSWCRSPRSCLVRYCQTFFGIL